ASRCRSARRRRRPCYFLFRRWTRVFRNSLRCFFFAILLRRFFMTEPTRPSLPTLLASPGMLAHARCRTAGHTPTFRLPSLVSPFIPPVPPLPRTHRQRARRAAQLAATNESRRYWLT